jgi:hypothetical protein
MSFAKRWGASKSQESANPDEGPEPILPEWESPQRSEREKLLDGWFIRDLADRPELVQKWKAMRDRPVKTVHDKQRHEFAAKLVGAVEDFLGEAV